MSSKPSDPRGRPIFLDLRRIRFPVGALASILHRLSGAVLVLTAPAALGLLAYSTRSPAAFREVSEWLAGVPAALVLAVLAAAFAHHLLAGVRILLLDAGIGVALRPARAMAWVALVGAAVAGLVALVALWPRGGA